MRYENWDVLLFPGGSRVPIQEFRTQCFVTPDRGRASVCHPCGSKMLMRTATESPYLLSGAFINPSPFYHPYRTVGQLPILTSFVPSLSPNNPFRVSIHSWEKPRASRTTEGLMQPEDSILFEVRIFFDNHCVAYVKLLPTDSC
jgi:hypothetical protein